MPALYRCLRCGDVRLPEFTEWRNGSPRVCDDDDVDCLENRIIPDPHTRIQYRNISSWLRSSSLMFFDLFVFPFMFLWAAESSALQFVALA